MTYYNKVKVNWSIPSHIDEAWDGEDANEKGLYFITRRYIRNGIEKESPLYVGVTTRSFYKRLREHYRDETKWTRAYGQKFISFGTISIYREDKYDMFDLLTEIETQIIQDLDNDYPGKLINRQQKKSHDDKYNLFIIHLNNDWLKDY